MSMDIPDEAPVRVYIDPHNGMAYVSKTPNSTELRFGKEAWAAFEAGIARAAQVAVLRETAVELRVRSVDVTWSTDLEEGLRWAAEDLQRKADELEAGDV